MTASTERQAPQFFACWLIGAGLLVGCGSDGATAGPNAGTGGASAGSAGTAGHNSGGAGQGGEAGDASEAGSAGDAGSAGAGDGDPGALLDLRGVYVKKARPGADGTLLLLLDKPLSLRVDAGSPQRELVHVRGSRGVLSLAKSTATRFLIDFTRHPSGELSLLFSSSTGYELERLGESGVLIAQSALTDDQIYVDPPVWSAPPGSAIDPLTRDGGRLEAAGEDVIVAARTGRHSVIAYRYDRAFERAWRSLVVPGYVMYGVGLTGGTYDTFGQLDCHTSALLAVDEAGRVYVATQHPHTGDNSFLKAHEKVFGEALVGDPDGLDIYVTRLDDAGKRLGTSVVGTPEQDELYGLHAAAGSALVTGRKEYPDATGTGFDALAARVDGATGEVEVRELDVDRSDLAFDAVALDDDSWLVAGVSGYSQNPSGASISEESRAFVQRVFPSREVGAPVALVTPNGKRHNEARTLALRSDGTWIVGGMHDGPGTHSADGDPSKLSAQGFLGALALENP